MIWRKVRVQGCVYERGGGCGRAGAKRAPSASLSQGDDITLDLTHSAHRSVPPVPLCRQAQLPQVTASDWFSRTRLRRIFSDSVQNSGVWSTLCPSQGCYPARAMKIGALHGHCWPLLWTGKKKKRIKLHSMVLHQSTASWPTNISCLLT